MWKRAVWVEGKTEEEGVVPDSWVDEEKGTLYWPQGVNAENALNTRQHPDPKSWRKFQLVKVKTSSDSYQTCDNYQLTSVTEGVDSSADSDYGEGWELRRRRKRAKKCLPEDFISSQDLHVLQKGTPTQQQNGTPVSAENQAPALSQKLAPSPPQKLVPAPLKKLAPMPPQKLNDISFPRRSRSTESDWSVDHQSSPRPGTSQNYHKRGSTIHDKELHHDSQDRSQQLDSCGQRECHNSQERHTRYDSQDQRERHDSRDRRERYDSWDRHDSQDQQVQHGSRDRRELHDSQDRRERHDSLDQRELLDSRDRRELHDSWDRLERRDSWDRLERRDSRDRLERCDSQDRREPEHHTFPMDVKRFQKRVLQLILDVREEVRETKSEVRDLKSIHCFTSFSDNNGLDLTIRHNNTLEELQEVENELENPTYYQEMFNKCVRIDCMNKKDMVSKLLSSFMTKNLVQV